MKPSYLFAVPKVFILLLALFLCFAPDKAETHEDHTAVIIAVLPCSDVVQSFERFRPITEYLEKKIGKPVQAVFPGSEKELASLLKNHKADFVIHSPYGYRAVADTIDKSTMLKALGPDGKEYMTGQLVVHKDSGIEKVTDLMGKKVLFGMECSASRWIAGRNLFKSYDMDIEKDLGHYSDGGCCESICFNVSLRATDAGLVCQHYYEDQLELGEKGNVKNLKVIATTDPIPAPFFAARKGFSPEINNAVREALMSINLKDPSFKELIHKSEIAGFVRADSGFYEQLSSQQK